MKNELDRRLKAQWEAASVEDFDLSIDTEKLWNKIDRPGKAKTTRLKALQYAAALLTGAVITFGLMQQKAPSSLALRSGLDRQETRRLIIVHQENEAPRSGPREPVLHKQAAIAGYTQPATGTAPTPLNTGIVIVKEELKKERQTPPGNLSPAPQARDGIVQVTTKSPPALKTIHLFDLEKPVPQTEKTNKMMMAIKEHTHKQSNDIAFSTKILTNQF